MKKAELQQYLTEEGVAWDAGDSAGYASVESTRVDKQQ
jgi:hypothetical protein